MLLLFIILVTTGYVYFFKISEASSSGLGDKIDWEIIYPYYFYRNYCLRKFKSNFGYLTVKFWL
jgi:hypothetical protein